MSVNFDYVTATSDILIPNLYPPLQMLLCIHHIKCIWTFYSAMTTNIYIISSL